MGGDRVTPVVLVTGARSPAALDIARDFAVAGYRVHMADSRPARLARWSKASAQVHRVPPPVQDPLGFRRDMAALVEAVGPALVVPTCEEVFHLAAARQEGWNMGPLFAPDLQTLLRLHAKDRFIDEARALGLDVPRTRTITAPLAEGAFDLDRVVIKARYSRFGSAALVRPAAGAVRALRPTPERPWVVQDFVCGSEHSSYAVVAAGEVLAFAAYRSPFTLRGGAGYAFVSAVPSVSERLLRATAAIAAATGLSGQIALDAIDDGERAWLIECNPRATSGVHMLTGSGAVARAMGGAEGRIDGPAAPRQNLPLMLSHGLAPCLRGRGREWRRLVAARDVIGARGDRLPLLGALADTLGFALQARCHGVTLTTAATRDIEWNGDPGDDPDVRASQEDGRSAADGAERLRDRGEAQP